MQRIEGKEVTIIFDGKKCIHSRNCVLGQPNVFKAGVKGDWIFPDNASAEDIAILAQNCPSGAIQYERKDGNDEPKPQVNTVQIMENGPAIVSGDLSVNGEPAGTRLALCRCGKSKNKPYCDGSHKSEEFVASGEVAPKEAEPLEVRDGPLAITPRENASVLIEGNVEILSGSGAKITVRQKFGLCVCGASGNKPFCDGSHNKIDFKTD